MGLRFRLRDFHSKKFQQQKNLKILDKTSTAYVKFEVSKFTLGDTFKNRWEKSEYKYA